MQIPKHPHTNEILFHLLTCSLYSVKKEIESCKDENLLSDLKQVENYLKRDYFEQAVYEIEHHNRGSKNNLIQVWKENCLVQSNSGSEIFLVKPLWNIITTHGTQNEEQSPEEYAGLGRCYFIDPEIFQTQVAQFRIDRVNNNLLNRIKILFYEFYSSVYDNLGLHLLELTGHGNYCKILNVFLTQSRSFIGHSSGRIDRFKSLIKKELGITITINIEEFDPLLQDDTYTNYLSPTK